ncbi:MAG: hypothetical protein PHP44_00020 [Kiritimatiellae bacterium]|nr:hypothetical protein [Kiritimatiellia bacterium]MDD4734470.1 hypothetical protein [Kiritimatiellia bacterium]
MKERERQVERRRFDEQLILLASPFLRTQHFSLALHGMEAHAAPGLVKIV